MEVSLFNYTWVDFYLINFTLSASIFFLTMLLKFEVHIRYN